MADGDPMVFTHENGSVLLPNPGAEFDENADGVVDSWGNNNSANGTPSQDSGVYHEGLYSQKFVIDPAQTQPITNYWAIRYLLPYPVGGSPADYYENAVFVLKAWVLIDKPSFLSVKTRVSLCDVNWSEISGTDVSSSPSPSAWTEIVQTISLGTPNSSLRGIEFRLHHNLAVDNPSDAIQVFWDDLRMFNAYTFARNAGMPQTGNLWIPGETARLVNSTFREFRHPASEAKWKCRLRFGLISEDQMKRILQFWLAGKPFYWWPFLPKYPEKILVLMTGEPMFQQASQIISAGYSGDVSLEEV
jgi:hypothetical protein